MRQKKLQFRKKIFNFENFWKRFSHDYNCFSKPPFSVSFPFLSPFFLTHELKKWVSEEVLQLHRFLGRRHFGRWQWIRHRLSTNRLAGKWGFRIRKIQNPKSQNSENSGGIQNLLTSNESIVTFFFNSRLNAPNEWVAKRSLKWTSACLPSATEWNCWAIGRRRRSGRSV